MVPTHDDMFEYLDRRAAHGQDVHGRDPFTLAAEFAHAAGLSTIAYARLIAYAHWVDEWKEWTPVGCA